MSDTNVKERVSIDRKGAATREIQVLDIGPMLMVASRARLINTGSVLLKPSSIAVRRVTSRKLTGQSIERLKRKIKGKKYQGRRNWIRSMKKDRMRIESKKKDRRSNPNMIARVSLLTRIRKRISRIQKMNKSSMMMRITRKTTRKVRERDS